jgi:hypothetical protein
MLVEDRENAGRATPSHRRRDGAIDQARAAVPRSISFETIATPMIGERERQDDDREDDVHPDVAGQGE